MCVGKKCEIKSIFADSGLQAQVASKTGDGDLTFFSSSKVPATVGGKASLQPKRTPVSNEEIEAILVCKPVLFHDVVRI